MDLGLRFGPDVELDPRPDVDPQCCFPGGGPTNAVPATYVWDLRLAWGKQEENCLDACPVLESLPRSLFVDARPVTTSDQQQHRSITWYPKTWCPKASATKYCSAILGSSWLPTFPQFSFLPPPLALRGRTSENPMARWGAYVGIAEDSRSEFVGIPLAQDARNMPSLTCTGEMTIRRTTC